MAVKNWISKTQQRLTELRNWYIHYLGLYNFKLFDCFKNMNSIPIS